jgi:DNA replication protein DnaC
MPLDVSADDATEQRLGQAGFAYAATIEQFDFRYKTGAETPVILRYLDTTFVEQARSLSLIGPPGLGKTMLPSAWPPNTSSWAPPSPTAL